jgi:hypothetical protein
MRTKIIVADGFTVTVRGRSRRTLALEQEYLVNLKQTQPDMKAWQVNKDGSIEDNFIAHPRGVSLSGSASSFRYLMARISEIKSDAPKVTISEPFKPDELVAMFNLYLDAEEQPDRSDLWSQVEDAITRMDTPEPVTDPNSASGLPMKQPH